MCPSQLLSRWPGSLRRAAGRRVCNYCGENQRYGLIIHSLRTPPLASTPAICGRTAPQGDCTLTCRACGCVGEKKNKKLQLRRSLRIVEDRTHVTVERLHDLQSTGFQGPVWFTRLTMFARPFQPPCLFCPSLERPPSSRSERPSSAFLISGVASRRR